MTKIKDDIKNYKTLHKYMSKYTAQELKEFLDKNSQTPTEVLACICSEVLRRMLLGELKCPLPNAEDSAPITSKEFERKWLGLDRERDGEK